MKQIYYSVSTQRLITYRFPMKEQLANSKIYRQVEEKVTKFGLSRGVESNHVEPGHKLVAMYTPEICECYPHVTYIYTFANYLFCYFSLLPRLVLSLSLFLFHSFLLSFSLSLFLYFLLYLSRTGTNHALIAANHRSMVTNML